MTSPSSPSAADIKAAWEKIHPVDFAMRPRPDFVADFMRKLPIYIPALLSEIERLSRPRPWVERPTSTGWWWAERPSPLTGALIKSPYLFKLEGDQFLVNGGLYKMSDFPGARFQGPIAPDEPSRHDLYRKIFDAGFKECRLYADNFIHYQGDQADKVFAKAMSKIGIEIPGSITEEGG